MDEEFHQLAGEMGGVLGQRRDAEDDAVMLQNQPGMAGLAVPHPVGERVNGWPDFESGELQIAVPGGDAGFVGLGCRFG